MSQITQGPTVPPPQLAQAVKDDLAAEGRRRKRLWAALCTLLASLFAAYSLLGSAPFLRLSLVDQIVAVALLGGGFFLVGLALGIRLPRARWVFLSLWGAALAGFSLLTVSGFQGLSPVMPFWEGRYCLYESIGVAILCLILALGIGFRLYRRHAPTGALMGVGMALVALAPMHLACSDKSLSHLTLWHGLSIILLCLGTIAAWRVLWNSRDP